MATAEASEIIKCGTTEAFRLLADPDLHPLWQADLESDGIVDGDGGAGSRGREVRRFAGRLVTTEYEVTENREPELWAMRSLSGPISMTAAMSCLPVRDGTEVRIEMGFSGWYGEAMARFAKRQVKEYLRGLKAVIEDGKVPAGDEIQT